MVDIVVRRPESGRSLPGLALALMMAAALSLGPAAPAQAWLSTGHARMTRAAVDSLPPTLPAFFRENPEMVAGASLDPDAFRGPTIPELTAQEGPEHFFDIELIQPLPIPAGFALPANRYAFLALCKEKGVEANKVGLVPYATAEWTQRLAAAFAQHRRWPDDPGIRARCQVYAGILAHYAQDLCQPLHVTVHYDGRVDAAGKSPRSGIHFRVDALPGRPEIAFTPEETKVEPEAIKGLLTHLAERLAQSNSLVDKVYAMEGDLPPSDGKAWTASPAVREFTVNRFRAAASLTASLYLTAWEQSAHVPAPDWLAPSGYTQTLTPPRPATQPASAPAMP